MVTSLNILSLRRDLTTAIGSYNDRNDGFDRSNFSRSKHNYSRNTKQGKVKRVKLPHKTWN